VFLTVFAIRSTISSGVIFLLLIVFKTRWNAVPVAWYKLYVGNVLVITEQ